MITDDQFQSFLKRHEGVAQLVPESNSMMKDSYLILDEYVRNAHSMRSKIFIIIGGLRSKILSFYIQMRFLDCTKGRKDPSKSILDVGVAEALKFSGFDEAMFFKRGGKYTWSKEDMKLEW